MHPWMRRSSQGCWRTSPAGRTVKDGRFYRPSAWKFIQNAGVPRIAQRALARLGLEASLPSLSLATFLVLLIWMYYRAPTTGPELIYWQAVLVVVLLSAPLTWAMGTVWLLPVSLMLWLRRPPVRLRHCQPWFVLCLLGLVVAAFPDGPLLAAPALARLFMFKYVLAEGLVLAGLTSIPPEPAESCS